MRVRGQGTDWRSPKKPRDRKIELMRRAKTAANEKFGIDGRRKEKFAPKPISLPKMPWDSGCT